MADTLTDALAQLSTEDLIVLGTALRTGRLAAPYSEAALGRVLGAASGEVARTMQALVSQGFSSTHLVVLCETVAAAKAPKSAVGPH